MPVVTLPEVSSWEAPFASREAASRAARELERGAVVFFPGLVFALEPGDEALLTPAVATGRTKNVSLERDGERLDGAYRGPAAAALVAPMRRFASRAAALVRALYPGASGERTSFRPVEAEDRSRPWRSDDRRLHVDAFPTRPTGGARILRVFANLSADRPRVWRVGGPFHEVAARFADRLGRPSPVAAAALQALGVTRGRRTAYDQRMLRLHDAMKRDATYQADPSAAVVSFPPGAVWLVFTDQVPHAVLSGRLAFERTFLVGLESLETPASAPARVLEEVLDVRKA